MAGGVQRGRGVTERIDSAILRNALGDPARRAAAAYLPPGCGDSQRRYPSAKVLAIFNARGTMLPSPIRSPWLRATRPTRWLRHDPDAWRLAPAP